MHVIYKIDFTKRLRRTRRWGSKRRAADQQLYNLSGVLKRNEPAFDLCKIANSKCNSLRTIGWPMEAGLLHQEKTMARQAIWESIANTTPEQLIAGYSELIQRQIDQDASNAFLLTFMFKSLTGSRRSVLIK